MSNLPVVAMNVDSKYTTIYKISIKMLDETRQMIRRYTNMIINFNSVPNMNLKERNKIIYAVNS